MIKKRLTKAQTIFASEPIDALLISNFYNIAYLSGIKTLSPEEREAFMLITPKSVYFFTDGRYVSEKLLSHLKKHEIIFRQLEPSKRLIQHIREIVEIEHIARLGFEKKDLKYIEYEVFSNQLPVTLRAIDELPCDRSIKDTDEIASIRKACELADICFKELIPSIRVGQTEKELAWKMESWMWSHGYEPAFDSIVAVDANAAIPHYNTKRGEGVVGNSSVILFDFGVEYNDYASDISRMVFVGKPTTERAKAYETLLKSQTNAITHITKEMSLKDIDALCRQPLIDAGYASYLHSTGHGVGLEVHEAPHVSALSKGVVRPHQVFTIEPGIYIPDKFGMRIEDTVLILSNGVADPLTKFPKELLIV